MKKIQNFVFATLGLIAIISLIVGAFYTAKLFISYLNEIDASIAAAIIAASGTILTAVLTVVIGQTINKKREIEDAHRVFKIEIYSKFIDFTINWVFSQSRENRQAMSQQELEDYFIDFSKKLTLWASPEVIIAWSKFRNNANNDSTDTLLSVDNIYRAMRKDLGNSNKGLNNKAIINLYLNEHV